LAAQAPPDATLVVFNTALLGYISFSNERLVLANAIAKLKAVWISNEAPAFSFCEDETPNAVCPIGQSLLVKNKEPWTEPASQKKNAAAGSNLPVKTFRLGRIKAAVWENEGEQKFYSVTFARTYVDEASHYHATENFGRDDLPLVAKLADQAHTFIFERLAELKNKQSE